MELLALTRRKPQQVAVTKVCKMQQVAGCHTAQFFNTQVKRVEVAHALNAVDYDDVGAYNVLRVAWETLHPDGWLPRPLQPERFAMISTLLCCTMK